MDAIATIEPGRWGIAVSGGADSTALLRLAAADGRLALHVIHLDHETRGDQSAGDAQFVARLATEFGLPATIQTRTQLSATLSPAELADLPQNPSACYRALRLALYQGAVVQSSLQGVLLAHHADDQAETILLRLLRGGGYQALAGMAERSLVAGVVLRRPLLHTRRVALLSHLQRLGQTWREDASNATGDYGRNRVRAALADQEPAVLSLLAVGDACRALSAWVDEQSPVLADAFPTRALANQPAVLARAATAAWLLRQGVPSDQISPAHVESIVALCQDAAMPPRLSMPGGITIFRRQGMVHSCRPHTSTPVHNITPPGPGD